MLEYKDIMGSDIIPGDFIVYGAMTGQSPALRVARVVELTTSKPSSYAKTVPKIKVRSVQISYNGPELLNKLITLEQFDRICKMQEKEVSSEIRTLLG